MAGYHRRIIRRSLALTVSLILGTVIAVAGQDSPSGLAGYVTEEVEPGVWRVDSDGVRDLARPYGQTPPRAGVVAGPDGSVWLLGPREHLELGGEAVALDKARRPRQDTFAKAAIGPDGRLWWTARGLHVHDGTEWKTVRKAPRKGATGAVLPMPDGVVLAALSRAGKTQLARFDEDGWVVPNRRLDGYGEAIESDGETTLLVTAAPDRVWRQDSTGWSRLKLPAGEFQAAALADDGTFWVRLAREGEGGAATEPVLGYWDGDSWTIYRSAHAIPASGSAYGGFGTHAVDPDGTIWFPARDPAAGPLADCEGIASFDRKSVTWRLRDHCVHDLDVAPDGGVWFIASKLGEPVDGEITEVGPIELYYIPPGS